MPQFEQVSVFSSLIFWSLVSFGAFLFLLKRFAFPPILAMLEEREKKIRGDIDSAEKLKLEAQKLKEEFAQQLQAAHEKANTIIHLATEESKKHQERALQDTQAKVRQLIKDAEQEIVSSRNKLLSEIRGYTAALTIASTEKILNKVIDRNEKKRLIDESIEEVMKELEQRKS
jgi:F-type H+-transporting ATPase subunit b